MYRHIQNLLSTLKFLVLMCILPLVIGLLPTMIYQFFGGLDKEIDIGLRYVGCAIALLYITYIFNKD